MIEIGPKDGVIDAATQVRLSNFITQATAQTATGRPYDVAPLRTAALHGDYVDERLVERTRHGIGPYASTTTRFLHHNRQYSVVAISNEAGAVTERYRYDPFGVRTALAPDGITVRSVAIEDTDTGFTGRDLDQDAGLMYFRHRWYSPKLGRFISRDPAGYVDGMSLYSGYFVPNGVDPSGMYNEAGHFYTTYYVARAAGFGDQQAFQLAYWSQYTDEDRDYDAMRTGWNRGEVQQYLHSLTGGDPTKLRKYLGCLIKNGKLSTQEQGILIHALGDTYAHAYENYRRRPGSEGDKSNQWPIIGKGPGNMIQDGERLYPPVIGHGLEQWH